MASARFSRCLIYHSFKRLAWSGIDKAEAFLSVKYLFQKTFCSSANLKFFPCRGSFKHSSPQVVQFSKYIVARCQKVPLQYLLGEWPFRELMLKMRPPVLIARPETEELVDIVINNISPINNENLHFLDVGCGSGAIAVSLLKHFVKADATAIDLLPEAISLSSDNAIMLGVINRLRLICGSFNELHSSLLKFDFIVSNPPYIETSEIPLLDDTVKKYESHLALDGGIDGLSVIKQLLLLSRPLLKDCGPRFLFLEIGHSQAEEIKRFINESVVDVSEVSVYNDFQGHARFLKVVFG